MDKKINDAAESPDSGIARDIEAYGRVLNNMIAGLSFKYNKDIEEIARLFNIAALEITDRYLTLSPTPPLPLIRRQRTSVCELTPKDIIDEETVTDTRVLAERTPSIPIVFDLDNCEPLDQQPTPDIFEQVTPTYTEDTEYRSLIELSVREPDLSTGPLPKYVQYDHELSPTPSNRVHPKIVFSFPRTEQTPIPEMTLTGAIFKLADVEIKDARDTATESNQQDGNSSTDPLALDWDEFES